jgi:hypothetical protein
MYSQFNVALHSIAIVPMPVSSVVGYSGRRHDLAITQYCSYLSVFDVVTAVTVAGVAHRLSPYYMQVWTVKMQTS